MHLFYAPPLRTSSVHLLCPRAELDMVTIQFPDPHFKNKHKKRRVVNAALVDTIVRHLAPGKHVFVQSGKCG